MTLKKVSISLIIPTYNSKDSLKKCIRTVLNQNTQDSYEIIVTDDGSTDGTHNFMNYYQEIKNIKYIHHENVWLAENRNIGARQSKGDILIFLDADMIASKNFLRQHTESLIKTGERGLVIGSVPVAEECKKFPVGRYLDLKWNKRLVKGL